MFYLCNGRPLKKLIQINIKNELFNGIFFNSAIKILRQFEILKSFIEYKNIDLHHTERTKSS